MKEDNHDRVTLKEDKDGRIFDAVNLTLLLIFTAVIIVPVWNIVANSFSTGAAIHTGGFVLWPSDFSLDNYRAVLSDNSLYRAAFISISRTVLGSLSTVAFCAMVGYGMSKDKLVGRKLYSTMGIITMFFGGGMIPTFLLIRNLGLLNSFWVYIIPGMFSYWNVIILMGFFKGIPDSVEESALIDGAGYWRTFISIVLPMSKPVLAAIGLFTAVGHWNDFMTARLYVTDRSLHPLAMRIFEIVVQNQAQDMMGPVAIQVSSTGIQLATIVITTAPIIAVYPFLQKYFVSGVSLGAVKE